MIDEQRTLEIFGYVSSDWAPKSHKKVVVVCEECGGYRVIAKSAYVPLCHACSIKTDEYLEKQKKYRDTHPTHGEKNNHWKGGGKTVLCKHCGKPFKTHHPKERRVFCSVDCMNTYMIGDGSALYKERIVKICEVCGKSFEVLPKDDDAIYCSNACKYEKNRGEDNGMYGKHHTDESCQMMSAGHQGIPYEEWTGFSERNEYCEKFDEPCRERIREKYDYECFICGRLQEENITKNGKQKKLSVHHVDKNKGQGCDGVKWMLVPVCVYCHTPLHSDLWVTRVKYLLGHVDG